VVAAAAAILLAACASGPAGPLATIDGVEWAPGETLFLRWVDFDAPGFDAGMSVEDFSMTAAIPEPSTVALTMGLLAGLGVWLRRRKN
jgi:hypothetical protein